MTVKHNTILIDEQQWVEDLKKGSEKAFRKIYDHYHTRLYRFSRRFMGTDEEAKEIVQEVFLKLWAGRQSVNTALSLQGYLYTIARHLNYKYLQRVARDLALSNEIIYRSARNYHHAEDELFYNEYMKIAEDAVERLSPHRKLVYRMSWKEGMTPQEISNSLDLSVSTVKNHLVEARKYIKAHLLLNADLSVWLLLFINIGIV